MVTDLRPAVVSTIDDLKRRIASISLELTYLKAELKRHETVLGVLGRNGKRSMQGAKAAKLRYVNFGEILARLPETFTTRDFYKATLRTKKFPAVFTANALALDERGHAKTQRAWKLPQGRDKVRARSERCNRR